MLLSTNMIPNALEIDISDFVKMLQEDFKLGWPEEDYICLGELFDGQSKDGRVELSNILSYDKTPMDKAMLCATVIIYLLYPTIVRSMFTSLSCKFNLEDGNSFAYLEYDLESACYDATHIWFAHDRHSFSWSIHIAFPIIWE